MDELDTLISEHIDRALDELTLIELSIFRIGCYELKYHLETPYRVIINESIELAKDFGATESHKFINGVFDSLAKPLRPLET